jgi:hypothetical protein
MYSTWFPSTSKKHSEILQIYSNTEADKDRIWKIATEIWNGMSSSMVARALLLAYRIMGKIIKTNGDAEWLKNGASHCHVRKDYVDTDRGVMRMTDVVDVEDNELESSMWLTFVLYCSLSCYALTNTTPICSIMHHISLPLWSNCPSGQLYL